MRRPSHLPAATQATAIAALKNVDALLAEVEQIKTQRDRIVARLKELGLKPSVSDSNFVFFGGLEDPQAIWQGLLEAGIIVRNNGIPGPLRVTAGTESETTAFLDRLSELLEPANQSTARS